MNPKSPTIHTRQIQCPATQGSQIKILVASARRVTSVQKKNYSPLDQKQSHHIYEEKGNGK